MKFSTQFVENSLKKKQHSFNVLIEIIFREWKIKVINTLNECIPHIEASEPAVSEPIRL